MVTWDASRRQVGEAVLPVMLMPEEAALVLDLGLASLSMLVPAHEAGAPENPRDAGCGASLSEPEDSGRVSIPHVPPPDGGDSAQRGGGLIAVELRKSAGAAAGWGLAPQALRATQSEKDPRYVADRSDCARLRA